MITHTVTYVREYCLDGFLAAAAAGLVAPWLGIYLVLRRMPFMAIAMPQLAGCGLAAAYFLFGIQFLNSFSEVIHPAEMDSPPRWMQVAGAALVVLSGVLLLTLASRRSKNSGAHAVLAYLAAFGASEILFLESPYEDRADQLLHHGRLLSVLADGRNVVLLTSFVTASGLYSLRHRLLLSAVDPDLMRLQGRSPAGGLFITLLLVGLFSSLVVPEVGPEVVLALLIIPPVVLQRVSPSLASYGPLCSFAGFAGATSSFVFALAYDWPVGPALVVSTLLASCAVAVGTRLFTLALPRRRP